MMNSLRPWCVLISCAWLTGCDNADLVWVPFNSGDQELSILVQPDCTDEQAAPSVLELQSSLRKRHVGDAVVTPGCGAVGTEHELAVEVFDEWQDLVGRVTVTVISEAVSDLDGDGEADSRGEQVYDLRRDSADIGVYAITLQSQGAPGETREDVFQIVLFQPESLEETIETAVE
ncbi:MAG TPA: hypothetical protein ENK18_27410 [Deltaproteobacteria bacterium]|nr:hypothetical protein [Deltaproteobacteria bacterium]